jgi:hypothetical protein
MGRGNTKEKERTPRGQIFPAQLYWWCGHWGSGGSKMRISKKLEMPPAGPNGLAGIRGDTKWWWIEERNGPTQKGHGGNEPFHDDGWGQNYAPIRPKQHFHFQHKMSHMWGMNNFRDGIMWMVCFWDEWIRGKNLIEFLVNLLIN